VAKECYEALYANRPADFIKGRAGVASMPSDYCEQLLAACRCHLRQVDSLRQGVRSVSVSRAERDTSLHVVEVFLLLTYGDGSREEVVVPMVEHNGQWKMK
jgi:hypothetical protein